MSLSCPYPPVLRMVPKARDTRQGKTLDRAINTSQDSTPFTPKLAFGLWGRHKENLQTPYTQGQVED